MDDACTLFRNKKGFKSQWRNDVGIGNGKRWKSLDEWQRQPAVRSTQPGRVHRDQDKNNRRHSRRCYICGKVGHFARVCWFGQKKENATTFTKKRNEAIAAIGIVEINDGTALVSKKTKPRENSMKHVTTSTSSHEKELQEMLKEKDKMLRQKDKELKVKEREQEKLRYELKTLQKLKKYCPEKKIPRGKDKWKSVEKKLHEKKEKETDVQVEMALMRSELRKAQSEVKVIKLGNYLAGLEPASEEEEYQML
ncbi:hypothetical protein BT93_L0432 [Corymbia citriodora subsp. variegata]|uniref:CCHC-type domain-containing protein n=1 Tax=Corymbia citriodora subsp. variegata TaxID=360336 RepID=A0A8T0CUI8_CORYI|nr:hypothetical protein BT93_L0432 [Corymbia citriodora subsp. variegata]